MRLSRWVRGGGILAIVGTIVARHPAELPAPPGQHRAEHQSRHRGQPAHPHHRATTQRRNCPNASGRSPNAAKMTRSRPGAILPPTTHRGIAGASRPFGIHGSGFDNQSDDAVSDARRHDQGQGDTPDPFASVGGRVTELTGDP
jgi:hypothetical protein